MYGDFSRMIFSRRKQYSSVWSQQGRVQLDADANEQAAIVLDYLRTLATDVIGPFGGPAWRAGFHVSVRYGRGTDWDSADLRVGAGHYYVYGLRCEALPIDAARLGQPPGWRHQPRGPQRRGELPEPPFLVYLRVWEGSVSSLQDPGLLEPALGLNPPDTTTRSQVAWEVVAADRLPGWEHPVREDARRQELVEAFADYNADPGAAGLLRARAAPPADPDDQRAGTAAAGRYRGASSQLYRVEIHRGGTAGEATFKCSRENGAVAFAIESLDGNEAVLASLGRDARTGLEVSDWVEITDDRWTPYGEPPPLLRVAAIDHVSRRVRLEGAEIRTEYPDSALHPVLRRWDQQPDRSRMGADNAQLLQQGTSDQPLWLNLEEGVQVEFPADGTPHRFRRGDYWLIPARAATGDVLWPSEHGQAVAQAPQGPARYVAPLALVRSRDPDDVIDLRSRFVWLGWPDEDPDDD